MRKEGRLNADGEDPGETEFSRAAFAPRYKAHRLKPVLLAGVLASGIALERGMA